MLGGKGEKGTNIFQGQPLYNNLINSQFSKVIYFFITVLLTD